MTGWVIIFDDFIMTSAYDFLIFNYYGSKGATITGSKVFG
jgi:hypothetical protein